MKPLKIGKHIFKTPIFLAPLVDVTDLPYRLICREQGAAMAYTEMLNIGSILNTNPKTQNMLKTSSKDKPSGIQITGRSIEEFKSVIPYLKKFDIVDINCGCPSQRISNNQSGSYLLNEPKKIASFIKILKSSGLTVTTKIRLGFKTNNSLSIVKEIEKAGADALTVHSRLATQGSSIPADHSWTRKIKSLVSIPVISNGDIFTPQEAKALLSFTDGVMIARGAIGNPEIFKQISSYLKTGKIPEITKKQNLSLFLKYLTLTKKHEVIEIPRIKYIGSRFLKGFQGSAKIRQELISLKTHEEISNLVKTVIKSPILQ
jgi:tRNA-dihydrouridine synthase B